MTQTARTMWAALTADYHYLTVHISPLTFVPSCHKQLSMSACVVGVVCVPGVTYHDDLYEWSRGYGTTAEIC